LIILEPEYDGSCSGTLVFEPSHQRMISLPMVILPITEQTLPDPFRHGHYFIA
jgi:hypothetical protein